MTPQYTNRATRQGGGSRGFTLMEVLVTLVVLGTGIVLLSQGITAAIRSAARAERTTRAAQVADEIFNRMEIGEIDFQTQGDGDLASLGAEEGSAGFEIQDAWRGAYTWISDVQTENEDGLYKVTLWVTWKDPATAKDDGFEAVRLFYVKPEEDTTE